MHEVGSGRTRGASRALSVLALIPAFALLLATSASADVSAVTGGAFGLKANVSAVVGLVNVNIPATPNVVLPASGALTTQTVANVAAAPVLTANVLKGTTQGTLGAGGVVTSSASVANATVLGLLAAPVLSTGVVTSQCSASEAGVTGSATVANLTALGVLQANVSTAPNTVINVVGLGTIRINEQIISGTGPSQSIIVNAVHVILNAPILGTGDIIIAQSRCGVTGSGTSVPTGAIGGVLLTGLVAVAFTGYQITRGRARRRRPSAI